MLAKYILVTVVLTAALVSADIPPRDDTINPLSEDLCETEPELFVCTWILPDGGIASGPGRPGPNYLQIAATTTMDPEYHDTGVAILINITRNMPFDLFNNLSISGRVGLFTDEDETTIFPEYRIYRDRPECNDTCEGLCRNTCTFDGRKYDSLAGLGGVRATCVDDNFMCTEADPYYNMNHILLHEFAHTVHGYGLNLEWQEKIECAYQSAYEDEIWDLDSYAMVNSYEYFAEGVGVFFYVHFWNSSGGMNSCGKDEGFCESEAEARVFLKEMDPLLYDAISYVFTDNRDTVPGGLSVCPSPLY